MKKLLSLLLVFTMMLTLVSGAVAFAVDEPIDETAQVETVEPEAAPAEEPAETPAETPAESPAEESAEAPAEESAEAPVEESAEAPAEESAEAPVEESAEAPALDGADIAVSWVLGSTGTLSISGSGNQNAGSIKELYIDNKLVDISLYATSGRKAELSADYLNKLAAGEYDVKVVHANKTEGEKDIEKAGKLTVTAAAAAGDTTPKDDAKPSSSTTSSLADGYYVMAIGEQCIGLDMHAVQVKTVTKTDGVVTGEKGGYVQIINGEGGFQITAEDPPGTTAYVVLGAAPTTEPAEATTGVWGVDQDGYLFFKTDGATYYIASFGSGSIISTTDKSAAAKPVFYSISKPSGGGGDGKGPGGSGGKTEVYKTAITNGEAPNLEYVDAPRWINITDKDHPTKQEVTLSARFPDGVEADAMIFAWSFGDQAKTETISVKEAKDGLFTSKFTVDLTGLDVGVYPVSCNISFVIEAEEEESAAEETAKTDTAASEPTAATSISFGSNYIVVVGNYAIKTDGTAVPYDGKVSDDILWISEANSSNSDVFYLKNASGKYLASGGDAITLADKAASWDNSDGKLGYSSRKVIQAYVSGVSGTTVTLGKEGVPVTLYVVGGSSSGSSLDAGTYEIDVDVNVVIAKGVQANSLITFSDVHESWNDVGTAVKDTIIATGGFIPSLVIATGDFNNDRVAGNKSAFIEGCVNEIINRVSLQLAGIDTVWVSGNHDNGYATQYTNYNLNADLGIVLDDYASGPVTEKDGELTGTGTISGTGIIFDTRSEGYAKNAESSASIGEDGEGLIVIGLNYEDGDAFGKNDYGNGTVEGDADSVYKHIKKALDSVAADYNGELVIISSHAGLHNLKDDADASSTHDDNGYTISNSAAIVNMINEYVDEYGLRVMWLFGHDHSKGEDEFVKLPGATITATNTFVKDSEEDNEDIVLKFTYAHAGYVGSQAAGTHNNNYTYLTWDENGFTREERVADGNGTVRDYLTPGTNHISGSKGALSFRVGKFIEAVVDPVKPAQSVEKAFADFLTDKSFDMSKATFFDVEAVWFDPVAAKDLGDATEEEVKENGGVTFTLPYPDSCDFDKYNYEFKVLHLSASGPKEEKFTETADGLKVSVDSLSPFAVVYKETLKPVTDNQNQKNQTQKAAPAKAPKTGDDTNIVLWVSILVLCAGATAVVLPRKKTHR